MGKYGTGILSFRWEWKWDGNEVIEMGGNWYKKSIPAHNHTCNPDNRYEGLQRLNFIIVGNSTSTALQFTSALTLFNCYLFIC